MGESAKLLSEHFDKIMQERESLYINLTDISVSRSNQLDYAIPASKISSLSSGEFVGIAAADPQEKIKLKMFHYKLQNDKKVKYRSKKHLRGYPFYPTQHHNRWWIIISR